MAYEINYNDQRFQQVESQKNAALNEIEVTYGNMIGEADKYYQAQIDANKEWADKQTQLQNEKTEFAIQEIEQQKAQEKKDYLREQSGAYVDWQKQSNEYGVNAEQQAAAGLDKSGYSESSQVSMYNTYQNRVATAREAYGLAIQNYNNAITEARLQNNSILAEIAFEALQAQLELSLQGFQYKNQLILDKLNTKMTVDNNYYGRYQDVLAQINHENALAEEVRQFNASLAEDKRQFDATMAYQKAKDAAKASGSGSGSGGSRSKTSSTKKSASKSSGGGGVGGLTANKGDNNSQVSTYKGAVIKMESKGVDSAVAAGAMTETEWKRRRASYLASGTGGAEVKNYSSYKAYINDYVSYATK